MPVKSKNKIKKKNKPKIVRKASVPSGIKKETIKKVSSGHIEEVKKSHELQTNTEVQVEKSGSENAKNLETSEPVEIEKEKDAHLAKWISPTFVLTNAEALTYKICAGCSPFMVIWSVLQESYIVSITFMLVFAVSLLHLARKPEAIECVIGLDGIKLGDKLYEYGAIESFEINEESKVLKFKLKSAFLPLKEAYLEDQDPHYIRALLEYFLPEEKQEAVILSREKNNSEDEISNEELFSYLEKMEKKMEKEDS